MIIFNKIKIYKQIVNLIVILNLLLSVHLFAQEMAVPVKMQLALFLKILTYDRNLKTRAGDEIVIGVVYKSDLKKSLQAKDEFINISKEASVKILDEIPIQYVAIEMTSDLDLASVIARQNVDILYITPMNALNVKKICSISTENKILTLTGVPDYVELGIAVGIGINENKPLIVINLTAAKTSNANFNSQLLNLAKIIK